MRDLLHHCDPVHGHSYTLPIPVTLGAFSLLFLRQFGLDYDVWADFMPPELLVVLMPPPRFRELKRVTNGANHKAPESKNSTNRQDLNNKRL